jgi:hypothetical protein
MPPRLGSSEAFVFWGERALTGETARSTMAVVRRTRTRSMHTSCQYRTSSQAPPSMRTLIEVNHFLRRKHRRSPARESGGCLGGRPQIGGDAPSVTCCRNNWVLELPPRARCARDSASQKRSPRSRYEQGLRSSTKRLGLMNQACAAGGCASLSFKRSFSGCSSAF